MADTIDPSAVARDLFRDQPLGFPYSNFDVAELILPDGDDMGLRSDDDDIDSEQIETETGFGNVIVVDGMPKLPEEKVEKFLALLRNKTYSQIGAVKDVHLPRGPDGLTKGYGFIEFNTPQEAAQALAGTNGYKLDKFHTFSANRFDDFDRYMRIPEEYQPPAPAAFAGVEGMHSWLLDKLGRDQYAIRFGDETAVFWNDARRGRGEEVYKRGFWTETFIQWSPKGNMLATMHRQGVAVWGGPEWKRIQRYNHPGAQLIEFSPNEKYLLSYITIEPKTHRDNTTFVLKVFETRSGQVKREWNEETRKFAIGASAGPGGVLKWPVFKWAGGQEDLYFARLGGENSINIYCTVQGDDMKAPMDLLGGKALSLPSVVDFEWSPAEPLLVAYTRELGDKPAKVSLVQIPERNELRAKNLFNVKEVTMFWHPQGDYLAVQVERFTKSKKSTFFSFELFCIREKGIPMEVLEVDKDIPDKSKAGKVFAFAWEPKGHRFAMVHGESTQRPSVSFYSMKDDKGKQEVRLLGTMTGKSCNEIYWSPTGHNIVLAGLKSLNGQLEFFNVDEMEVMAAAEHFMATNVEWDPTGRYVATAVTAINQMENGFNIWSYNGKLVYSMPRDRFFQFGWRPRPASLLSAEKEAAILKNLKQYTKRYDEEDEAMLMQADADVLQERQRMQDEWTRYVESRKDIAEKNAAFVREMCGALAEELEFTMAKQVIEQVTDVKEEPYQA